MSEENIQNSNSNGNGRATIRDVMALQEKMFQGQKEILEQLSNLKVKVAVISGTVSLVITLVFKFIIK